MTRKKNTDEEENSPAPFYHQTENFSSAYFGEIPEHLLKSAQQADPKLVASLVKQLTDPAQREVKDQVLHTLKAGNAQELLVSIIRSEVYAAQRKALIAACWETGLDFSAYLSFFVEQAVKGDYNTALEAMTVIEEMAGPFEAQEVERAEEWLSPVLGKTDERAALFEGIATRIRQ